MNRKQRRQQKKKGASGGAPEDLMAEAAELFRGGRPEQALKILVRVAGAEPDSFPAQANLGSILAKLGRAAEAEEAYGRALEIEPDSTPVLSNLAILKAETGAVAEAEALYRRVLALDPGDAEAYHDLSRIKKFKSGDPDIKAMEKRRAQPALGPEDSMFLDFALAKALDDAGDHDRAFEFMASANRLKRATLNFDMAREQALAERITATFDGDFINAHGDGGFADERPVFIIGMPRSGTTLVEQILASHSQVSGAGEVNHFLNAVFGAGGAGRGLKGMGGGGQGFPEEVVGNDGKDFRRLGKTYMDLLGAGREGAQRITDKLPRNFFFAGLISLALPNARIVHCRRDPVATCLSCFQIHFPSGQEFTYDLGELGRFYGLYSRLMDHWQAVLGDRIYQLNYEDLVADPEPRMRGLLEFCGLPWEDACLAFHETDRQVSTASTHQVRQPVYKTAVGRWKNYRAHLGPLLEALGPLAEAE